ncbi:late embryogenesis abundant protein At1g64065-like [Corylus avellana]|uniref:late embryogenesis abundant protein At1g64065-like n=1 Tax=Corylus avellana TaxID=13451 RepID=UPI00286B3A42|nr:late embryogenesis abundant protein At1g64065-like [Corylus avellana]
MTEELYADRRYLRRDDLEFSTFKHGDQADQLSRPARSTTGRCFVCVLAGFVVLSVVVLVFAATVLRVKSPDAKLTSVTVKSLTYGGSPSPSFNATLVAEMSVKNMNFGYFEFESGVANVRYGGVIVGKRRIVGGVLNAKGTMKMNITVDLTASNVSEIDVNSGVLELGSYAKLRGRICSMKILKKIKTAEMNCTMTINLTAATINDLLCK